MGRGGERTLTDVIEKLSTDTCLGRVDGVDRGRSTFQSVGEMIGQRNG